MNTRRWLTNWKNSLLLKTGRGRRSKAIRRPTTEALESRMLLTALDCLGEIRGTMFNDLTEDGLTGDDIRIGGATVNLYLDGGNGTFDNGGGDDTFVTSVLTDNTTGDYSFGGLAAGVYHVEQDASLTGYLQRGATHSTITISTVDAQGIAGTAIDNFTDPTPPQISTATSGTPQGTTAVSAAIGGERDLFAEVAGAFSASTVVMRVNQIPGFAELVSAFSTTGRGTATWDGPDGDALTLDPTGLGGVDLSAAVGILTDVGASNGVTVMNLTIYSSGTDFSTATTTLPNTGAASTLPVFLSFANDFAVAGGAGADLSNVGAIVLEFDATAQPTTSVVAGVIQAYTPTIFTADFPNLAPMTLGGTVFNDPNNDGSFVPSVPLGEVGIDGVDVTLFEDTNLNGSLDAGDAQVGTTTTSGGGDYSFTNLFPGEYLVRIDAGNFAAAGALENLNSSTGNDPAPDPDDDVDGDDNGTLVAGAVVAQAITLINADEPITDGDTDNNTNFTVDFGFFSTVDIQVVKTDTADPITAGSGTGNLVYTVVATNNGPSDATGVEITDALLTGLPAGWILESATGTGGTTFDTNTGVWTIGSLANGNSETLTVTITVGASAAAQTVTNTATVSAIDQTDSDLTNNADSEDTTIVRTVDVQVVKSDNVDPVTAGSGAGNLIYTVVATNNGPSDASGVAITDALITSLPVGWTLVTASGTGGTTFNPATGVWTIGNLPSSLSETLTVTITVGAGAAAGTTTNTATVTALNETDSNPANNTDSEDTTVGAAVDIQVLKSDNVDPVTAGSGSGNLVYTVVATNNGPSDATGVTVTDALIAGLPAGWSLVSGSGTGGTAFNGSTGVWTIGNLANGASETLTVTLTVGASAAAGTTTNTATVSAVNETDVNPANNTDTEDTTVIRTVDVQVVKSDNVDPVTAGSGAGNLVYTVVATNNGPSDASGVTFNDNLIAALPTGWSLVSATGTGGSTFSSTTGVWTIGNLAQGASRTLTVTLTVGASAAEGTVTNTATLATVNETDSNLANNTDSEDTTIIRTVDVAVTKSDTGDPVTVGSGVGNLTYTVVATNNGPSDASSVAVTDSLIAGLPTGWTLDSATGSGGTTFKRSHRNLDDREPCSGHQ
ncbi:MAG: DUF11 domain-containing protein [Planctomycetaceae bacterium]